MADKAERDGLQAKLKENDIPSRIYYPKPMHKQQAFAGQAYNDGDYVNTIQLCDTVLALPIRPYLKDEDMMKVVETVREYKARD